MPSFFSRRYMRGRPRRTERLVGVLVLGILALIVGLFALTGGLFANVVHRVPLLSKAKDAVGLSERPLFVPDPKNVKPPAPPHEMREAMALLPVPQNPDWVRDYVQVLGERASSPPTKVLVEEPSPATYLLYLQNRWGCQQIQENQRAFDVRSNYTGYYRPSRFKPGLAGAHVLIADFQTPAAAFGFWRAVQPEELKTVALGQSGSMTKDGRVVTFWAGRFATLVVGDEDAESAEVEALARLIASVQLNYGSPFWSETVLPREGQVVRSFRYVKSQPLGMAELGDCWLADYQNGLTIGVMQPASPERLLASLKQRAASQPAEVHVMESEALAAATVTWAAGDKTLTAFDAGPYVFVIAASPQQTELVASTAKMLHDRWSGPDASAMASASGVNPQSAIRNPQSPAAGSARFAEVDGLDAPAKTERYTDNLYEKIDGREPMFRSFNFVELRFGQYLDGRNKLAYDVYLYDMAEPNNALGIFMKERSGAGASANVGRDSYVSGTNVYFWKGKYYVNVLAPADGGDAVLATAKRIASAVADTIADTGGGFWAEDVLPKEDRVPESFKYIASSALSYDFLNRVYRADYKTGDKTYGLFALKASNPERARELFLQLADAAKRYGDDIEQRVDTPGSELVVTRSLDVYMVAFCKGVFVGGVADCDDQELAIAKAKLLRERMPADAPGEPEPAASGSEPPTSEGKSEGKTEDGESHGESDGY